MAFVGSGLAIYIYDRMNKAKERQCIKDGLSVENQAQYVVVGSDSPLFRCVTSY